METNWIIGGLGHVLLGVLGGIVVNLIFLFFLQPSFMWRDLWEKGPFWKDRSFVERWEKLKFGDKCWQIFFMILWLIGVPLLVLLGEGTILVKAIKIVLAGAQGDVNYLISVGFIIGFCLFLIDIVIEVKTDWGPLEKILTLLKKGPGG